MKTTFRICLTALVLCAMFNATASATTVDLLVLYDSYSNTYFGKQPATAMKSWVDQINIINQNSQVDIQWRLVGVEAHEDSGATMDKVLPNIRSDATVAQRRNALGADFVVQLHKTGNCGIAYVAVDKAWSYAVVGPNCGPNAMAHELGHNMGLNHSRRQGDTSGVRYPYGLGYGVDSKFTTIMAYESAFGNAPRVPKYSNPTLTCVGLPCGIPIGNSQQAFAAQALNNVKTEIASFYPSKTDGSGGVVTGGPGVTVYKNYSYGGYSATLAPGSYRLADLAEKGILNNDLSSAKIPLGFILELYTNDNFTGTRTSYSADISAFPVGVNDTTTSLIVKTAGIADGTYELRAKHSGLCLDVWLSNTADGASVDQYTCNSTATQRWQLSNVSGGRYEAKAQHSGKCLDVTDASTLNGALLRQWSCSHATNQLFYVLDNGDATVRLQTVHSGKVVDVKDASTTRGGLVQQWDSNGGANQRWMLRRVQ